MGRVGNLVHSNWGRRWVGGGFALRAYAQVQWFTANLGDAVGDVDRVGHGEEAGDRT